MKYPKFVGVISLVVMVLCLSTVAIAQDVPKITKEEMNAMLGNADLVVIDIRKERHWESSDSKIKGALKEDLEKVASWAEKYEKDKTYVLYCA